MKGRFPKICALLVAASTTLPAASSDTLEEGFRSPPQDAKPQVWYHIMNGNATKEGITCDFEVIAGAGLGGVQIFDVSCNTPSGPVLFGSPEWFALMRHAHNEAKRLGLQMGVANCSGWTSSGGPWITPQLAMKVVTTTETAACGPARFSGVLPRAEKDNGFYVDIAVLAYPTPAKGATIPDLASKCGRKRNVNIRRSAKEFAPEQVVSKDRIIDLTGKMAKDGTLEWDVPEGDWTILRAGFVCNGQKNLPASKNGSGLEVDKFSAKALDFHFDQYVGRLCRELGVSAETRSETGLNSVLIDSWEVGCQNWTQGMESEFEKRCGYSIIPYLPVLAGRVVGSVAESERFLEDFRRVHAQLFRENHAERFVELCRANGLRLAAEPYGNSNADNFAFGRALDIPMGCFWVKGTLGRGGDADNTHVVAPIAHVCGKRYVGVEACTSGPPFGGRWAETPFSLKDDCDRAFAEGGNMFFFHRFVHQPWPGNKRLPGMTLGRWGSHFDRTQTWWPFAGGFFAYISRCQWMLQEGRPCADVLYWCGAHSPNDGKAGVHLPPGFDYDFCDTEALLQLAVKDGKLVSPWTVEYSLLVVPMVDTMPEEVLGKIGSLVRSGAKVMSKMRPVRTGGLRETSEGYQDMVSEIWADGIMECNEAEALKRIGAAPDFSCEAKDAVWTHRRSDEADWYFIARDNAEAESFDVSLRIAGRTPEIWDAETGEIAEAANWRVENGRTVVTLDFRPKGSAFVVFRNKKLKVESEKLKVVRSDDALATAKPWEVSFPVDWYSGGTNVKTVAWTELKDWTQDDDSDIKYFSGTAVYKCKIENVKCKTGESGKVGRVILDLGEVREVAEVTVGGKKYPPLWRPPYRVDITDAVGNGKREDRKFDIEVKVANLWANRLIGDDTLYPEDCKWRKSWSNWAKMMEIGITEIPEWVRSGKPSPTGRKTWTSWKHYQKGDALVPSGLLGPVKIKCWKEQGDKER